MTNYESKKIFKTEYFSVLLKFEIVPQFNKLCIFYRFQGHDEL